VNGLGVPNGKRAILWTALCGLAFSALTSYGGFIAGVKSDAAWHERVDAHIRDSDKVWQGAGVDHQHGEQTSRDVAVLTVQVGELTKALDQYGQKFDRLGDKVDLMVQTMMRQGAINR